MDFDALKSQILLVNRAFYESVYKDPWFKLVFKNVTEEHIVAQQTDFMVGAFGGPKNYSGRTPFDAHPHIMATEEMWQLREQFLREAFLKVGTPVEIQEKWLKIDEAFKKAIVKMSRSQCERRYTMDEIIDIPDPLCRVFGSPEFKKVA